MQWNALALHYYSSSAETHSKLPDVFYRLIVNLGVIRCKLNICHAQIVRLVEYLSTTSKLSTPKEPKECHCTCYGWQKIVYIVVCFSRRKCTIGCRIEYVIGNRVRLHVRVIFTHLKTNCNLPELSISGKKVIIS